MRRTSRLVLLLGVFLAALVFVVVLLSLQVFLLTVGVDALLADDDGLAWVTGGFSVLLALGSSAFYRFLR